MVESDALDLEGEVLLGLLAFLFLVFAAVPFFDLRLLCLSYFSFGLSLCPSGSFLSVLGGGGALPCDPPALVIFMAGPTNFGCFESPVLFF